MGPRRVGKTVLLRQFVEWLIGKGAAPDRILYVSVDQPVYTGLSLEKLLTLFIEERGHDLTTPLTAIFDEIQYLPDWEIHLKTLVDSFPNMRFIASGSAAAALRLRSRESGAGRFTDFLLPPLTFPEFCYFKDIPDPTLETDLLVETAVETLNQQFINYINFGGFPEAVLSDEIQKDFGRFVGQDIIDKVLLRDLPTLYGIHDTRELHRFFAVLAYNSGEEVSLEGLSQASGVAKNTLKRYLEYLEAAFLIKRISRIDKNARRFQRETHFKVYLTNPCLRAALYGPVGFDDPATGKLVETAIIGQWSQARIADYLHYARWRGGKGEVDVVLVDETGLQPRWIMEIKWSDRIANHPEELNAVFAFADTNSHRLNAQLPITVLTRTVFKEKNLSGYNIHFVPASYACFVIGRVFVEEVLDRGLHPWNFRFPATSS